MTHLADASPPPGPGDVLLHRVIFGVVLIGLSCIVGIVGLEWRNAAHPGILDSLSTGALVGLTGLLAARHT